MDVYASDKHEARGPAAQEAVRKSDENWGKGLRVSDFTSAPVALSIGGCSLAPKPAHPMQALWDRYLAIEAARKQTATERFFVRGTALYYGDPAMPHYGRTRPLAQVDDANLGAVNLHAVGHVLNSALAPAKAAETAQHNKAAAELAADAAKVFEAFRGNS